MSLRTSCPNIPDTSCSLFAHELWAYPSPYPRREFLLKGEFLCVISQSQHRRECPRMLPSSFQRCLSCPLLSTDIQFEETNIRYTAIFCFCFCFFHCFSPPFFFHTHKTYLTDSFHQITDPGGVYPSYCLLLVYPQWLVSHS